MSKVSIGFRGWRFDEDEVFDEDGNYRPLDEMSEDTRDRLSRIPLLTDRPCDVCYLEHGATNSDDTGDANAPTAVYGEPGAEVLVCDDHEREFYYWFLEEGGEQYRGTDELQDAFHEWVAGGERAPEWYEGPQHVETDPERAPAPDFEDLQAVDVELPDDEQASVSLRDAEDLPDDPDLDIEAEYPTSDE